MEFRLQTIIALSIALLMLGCSTQTTTSAVPANLGDTSVQETIVLEDDDREIPTEPEELVVEKKDEIVVNPKSTKTFVFTGRNFMFEMAGGVNPTIRVKKGDTVKIEFTSTDGFHDWTIDKFNTATERVSTGGSTTVTFVADEAGTFEYFCSVGSHRQQGMFGKLVVV